MSIFRLKQLSKHINKNSSLHLTDGSRFFFKGINKDLFNSVNI